MQSNWGHPAKTLASAPAPEPTWEPPRSHRFSAALQRFDSSLVEVATGDNRAEVIAAATAVYTALVPSILINGGAFIGKRRDTYGDDEDLRRHDLESCLRAQEFGIGVYDTDHVDPANLIPQPPELIFWIGATREDAKL